MRVMLEKSDDHALTMSQIMDELVKYDVTAERKSIYADFADMTEKFGIEIIQEDGTLNRRLLAEIVFGDRAKTRRLNEMVQTAILVKAIERAHKLQLTDTKKVIFFDVPLLFEAGWDRYVKEVWLVTAPEDVRIERVEVRDGLTEAEIRKRIRLQMSEEEKMERSDVIIENDEGMAKLMMQVDKAIAERL